MDDVFSFSTTDSSFIIDGNQVTIPKNVIFQNAVYTQGFADYSLKLFIQGESGFIDLTEELLLATCTSLVSGEVDNADCRFNYHLIPSTFGGANPPICQ